MELRCLIIKAYLAGIVIGLGSLAYMACYGFGIGFTILGSFLFSFGLLTICQEQLNLVTGKFGAAYNGDYSILQVLSMFLLNILGVSTIFLIRHFDARPEFLTEIGNQIAAVRESKIWYQHILSGMICGACIQIAVFNFQSHKDAFGVMLPVIIFITLGGQHCIADTFYYLCAGITTRHIVLILFTLIGNFIGAMLVTVPKMSSYPHFLLSNKSLHSHNDN